MKIQVYQKQLAAQLRDAKNEKDVEAAYRTFLASLFSIARWMSPHNCDGLMVSDAGSALLEFKYDLELTQPAQRARVATQALRYLIAFRDEPQGLTKMPSCLFVGDINECYILPTSAFEVYMHEQLDLGLTPSSAHKQTDLLVKMAQDPKLTPSVVVRPQEEPMERLCEELQALLHDRAFKVAVTPTNLAAHFDAWQHNVLHTSEKKGLLSQEKVALFLACLLDRDKVYAHPKKNTQLIVEGRSEPVRIQAGAHDAFWAHFPTRFSLTERNALTSAKDTLVEEDSRRRTGEFFTPQVWVDEAHRHLDEVLGSDWKDRYIVWDSSCGLANLTRGYAFKHLFLSTLNQEDVDMICAHRYNGAGLPGGAVCFQFDFLNDPLGKLPTALTDAIEHSGKPLLFIGNPPYGTSQSAKKLKQQDDHKAGTTLTATAKQMQSDGLGGQPSQQLYTQFMYQMRRIVPDCTVAIFSKSDHMRSSSYRNFSESWSASHQFKGGFIFRADEFADVSASWAVCWNVWAPRAEPACVGMGATFNVEIKHRMQESSGWVIQTKGSKTLYTSSYSPRDQVLGQSNPFVKPRQKIAFKMTNALSVEAKPDCRGCQSLSIEDVCHYGQQNFNGPQDRNLVLFSTSIPHEGSQPVHYKRIRYFAPLMVLRDLVSSDWLINKDEFLAPEPNAAHDELFDDAMLYLPLCGKGEFSGLRDLVFPDPQGVDTTYQVKNHWAILSRKEVLDLADEAGFSELHADAMMHEHEHYAWSHYQDVLGQPTEQGCTSQLAKQVFELAQELTRLTIRSGTRRLMMESNPEYHLQAWDAGWRQTRKVLEFYHPKEWEAFKMLKDAWKARLQELVYEAGYLV
jgi:hypothetical protein